MTAVFIPLFQLFIELLRTFIANVIVRKVDVRRNLRETADAFVFAGALVFRRGVGSSTFSVYRERSEGSPEAQRVTPRHSDQMRTER